MFEFLKGVKLKDTKLQATAQDGTKFEVKTTMPNNNKQQGGPQQAPPPKPMQPPRMQVPPQQPMRPGRFDNVQPPPTMPGQARAPMMPQRPKPRRPFPGSVPPMGSQQMMRPPMPRRMNMGGKVMLPKGYNTGGLVWEDGEWVRYQDTIGGIESSNQYDITGGANDHYTGRYQLGADAITDASAHLGIDPPSREELLANPGLQDELFQAYTAKNDQYLTSISPEYNALDPQKKKEALAYAHNQGAGGAAKWLASGEVGSDAFGTPGDKYSQAYAQASIPGGGENIEPGTEPQRSVPGPGQSGEAAPFLAAEGTIPRPGGDQGIPPKPDGFLARASAQTAVEIENVDPYTGDVTLTDGTVLTNPTKEEIDAALEAANSDQTTTVTAEDAAIANDTNFGTDTAEVTPGIKDADGNLVETLTVAPGSEEDTILSNHPAYTVTTDAAGNNIYTLDPNHASLSDPLAPETSPRPPVKPKDIKPTFPNTPNTCLLYTSPSPRDS